MSSAPGLASFYCMLLLSFLQDSNREGSCTTIYCILLDRKRSSSQMSERPPSPPHVCFLLPFFVTFVFLLNTEWQKVHQSSGHRTVPHFFHCHFVTSMNFLIRYLYGAGCMAVTEYLFSLSHLSALCFGFVINLSQSFTRYNPSKRWAAYIRHIFPFLVYSLLDGDVETNTGKTTSMSSPCADKYVRTVCQHSWFYTNQLNFLCPEMQMTFHIVCF